MHACTNSQLHAVSNETIQRFVFLRHSWNTVDSYYNGANYHMDLDMYEIKLPLKNTVTNYGKGGEPLAWA